MFKKINRKNKKGFTLAELLIVVAIIGVLVAVSIPIFTAQLEKSREATDAANIRSAYAEVIANSLSGDGATTQDVDLKQQTAGWQNSFEFPDNLEPVAGAAQPAVNGTVTITATDTGASSSILLVKA